MFFGSARFTSRTSPRYLGRKEKDDGTNWSGWGEVSGGGTTDVALSAAVFGNRLYLFAKGIDDKRIYVNSYDGGSWSGWHEVPGGGSTDVPLSAASLGGLLYLFAKGIQDTRIYFNTTASGY